MSRRLLIFLVVLIFAAILFLIALTFSLGIEEKPPPPPPRAAVAKAGVDLRIELSYPRERVILFRCHPQGDGTQVKLCDARKLALFEALLKPDRDVDDPRTCTQVYGGPEQAHVRGILRSRKLDERFDRQDGCAIADYNKLLQAIGEQPLPPQGEQPLPQ